MMLTVKMRKVKLIIARDGFEDVLSDLIGLGCIEVSNPDELLDNQELSSLTSRETIALDKFQVNRDSITLLSTQHTLLLTGWTTSRSEQDIITKLSEHVCAWEFDDPSPSEIENVPVKLKWPKLTGLFYKGGGRMFEPLKRGRQGRMQGNDEAAS